MIYVKKLNNLGLISIGFKFGKSIQQCYIIHQSEIMYYIDLMLNNGRVL